MQLKTINSQTGETLKVSNEWAAQAESRGTTVTTSTWSVSGGLDVSSPSLTGTTATATVVVSGNGRLTNTITLANGETLVGWRYVRAGIF